MCSVYSGVYSTYDSHIWPIRSYLHKIRYVVVSFNFFRVCAKRVVNCCFQSDAYTYLARTSNQGVLRKKSRGGLNLSAVTYEANIPGKFSGFSFRIWNERAWKYCFLFTLRFRVDLFLFSIHLSSVGLRSLKNGANILIAMSRSTSFLVSHFSPPSDANVTMTAIATCLQPR